MHPAVWHSLVGVVLALPLWGQSASPQQITNGGDFSSVTNPVTKVPKDVILVKGAWSSASDSVTPVPEGSSVTNNIFSDPYFEMRYTLPSGWMKGNDGPPPSDSGRYVLALFRAADPRQPSTRGSVLITADDLFFTPLPAGNSLELLNYRKDTLPPDYKLEEPPTPTKIAGRSFTFFAYWSPVAQLHWYVLATQVRCHVVEIVLTSRDTKLLGTLLLDMDKMTLPAEANPTSGLGGGDFPVCFKDFARPENVLAKVDPVFTEHRYNPVPVRIIIDKKGRVKHIHFLSAFSDQSKAITDALGQWKFKPYLRGGQPVEVETGIMFGASRPTTQTAGAATD